MKAMPRDPEKSDAWPMCVGKSVQDPKAFNACLRWWQALSNAMIESLAMVHPERQWLTRYRPFLEQPICTRLQPNPIWAHPCTATTATFEHPQGENGKQPQQQPLTMRNGLMTDLPRIPKKRKPLCCNP